MRKFLFTILALFVFAASFVAQPRQAKADPTGLAIVTFGAMGMVALDVAERAGKIRIKQGNPAYGIACEMYPRSPEIPQCVSMPAHYTADQISAFYKDEKQDLIEFYNDTVR